LISQGPEHQKEGVLKDQLHFNSESKGYSDAVKGGGTLQLEENLIPRNEMALADCGGKWKNGRG